MTGMELNLAGYSLNVIWFILVGVLLAGWAILDGFDFGVGMLHLFTKTDTERRIFINSIGPVWDGNEVWLVTGGGALFAAFPEVYASAFSGFYLAFMLLLLVLIFRAVSIEFRSKREWESWRKSWDIAFSIASFLISILVGVAMGNIARGIPLDANHEYMGGFFDLLNPYAVLVGLTTASLFIMHGSIYLVMKTEGDLHDRVRGWTGKTLLIFIVLYVLTTTVTWFAIPHMTETILANPILFLVPVLNILAIINIPRALKKQKDFEAFISSCVTIVLLLALFGIGMFPNLIFSNGDVVNSLNVINAASTQKTLGIMLIIALIGMPLVIAYTTIIYRIFRGKVVLTESSY